MRAYVWSLVHFFVILRMVGNVSRTAYIDPNTGGMLFQLLAAAFAFFSGFLLFFSRQLRIVAAQVQRRLRRQA